MIVLKYKIITTYNLVISLITEKAHIQETVKTCLKDTFSFVTGATTPKKKVFDVIRLKLIEHDVHCYDDELWMESVVKETFVSVGCPASKDKDDSGLR